MAPYLYNMKNKKMENIKSFLKTAKKPIIIIATIIMMIMIVKKLQQVKDEYQFKREIAAFCRESSEYIDYLDKEIERLAKLQAGGVQYTKFTRDEMLEEIEKLLEEQYELLSRLDRESELDYDREIAEIERQRAELERRIAEREIAKRRIVERRIAERKRAELERQIAEREIAELER